MSFVGKGKYVLLDLGIFIDNEAEPAKLAVIFGSENWNLLLFPFLTFSSITTLNPKSAFASKYGNGFFHG